MPPEIEWHGEEARDYVRKRALRFVTAACLVISRRAKELLSVSGTGSRTKGGGVVRKVKGGKGRTVYGAFPSAPGEPPHKQTGRLRASVAYEVDEATLTGRVGTNVEYARHLELGTRRGLAARPWLRRALAESMGKVNEILSGIGK